MAPISRCHTVRTNIRTQNARQEEALAAYEKPVLASFENAENALVNSAKEQIHRHSLKEAVKSSRDSVHLANQLYSNGLTGFINVRGAERSLHHAEDTLVQNNKTSSVRTKHWQRMGN